MSMLFIDGLISDKILQSLCWTLLHSLWQGLLIAIMGAIIIMLTRRSSPRLRYDLFTALFILFIGTTGFTLTRQLLVTERDLADKIWITPAIDPAGKATIIHNDTIATTAAGPNYVESMVQYFNEHASLIVAIWFILLMAKLMRILSNIGYVQRIRHYKTSDPPFFWKQRIMELCQNLGLRRSVQLLESAIVKVPVVVGLLKPVILLPLGLLSNLTPQQVEAVLLHELAHIRRKDYLVNLLQSFAEAVFFFNPALLWISSVMREERENCCDDVAISRIEDKRQFIHALVAFQEYALDPLRKDAAIAFAGRKNYLLDRVKRIIYNENKKLNAMEKGFFILSIIAISLVGMISMKRAPAEKNESSGNALPATRVLDDSPTRYRELADSVPGPLEFKNLNSVTNKDGNGATKTITATDKSGKKYKLVMKNDDPVQLYVNDKRIPAAEMDNYNELISEIELAAEHGQKKDLEKMRRAREEQSEKMTKLDAERMLLMQKLIAIEEERAKLNYDQVKIFKDHEWENAARAYHLYDTLFKLRQGSVNDPYFNFPLELKLNGDDLFQKQLLDDSFNKYNADQLFQNENNELLQRQLLYENFDQFNMDQLNQNEHSNLLHEQILNDKMHLFQNFELGLHLQLNGTHLIDPIIEDMVAQNLISTKEGDLSFELSANKFMINGKKQPADVHSSYKEKYLKKNSDYYKYSRKNGSTNITTHSN